MAKLRKMLGDIQDPSVIALMKLIETQSSETLALWALAYVETHCLPVCEHTYEQYQMLCELIQETKNHLAGKEDLKKIKALIKEVNASTKEAEEFPAEVAACKAVSTACGISYCATNALGFTFYAVAAIVYDRMGLQQKKDVYDLEAKNEYKRVLASLKAVAKKTEAHPVKVTWNC